MLASKDFILRNIAGTNYLLPVGQKIADRKMSVKINDTGVFLWNNIQSEISFDDLLKKLIEKYSITPNEADDAKNDLKDFIDKLKELGIISTTNNSTHHINKYFNIAGINIGYSGSDNLLNKSLLDFECEKSEVKQHWIITLNKHIENFKGELIIRNDELEIFKCSNQYILRFPSFKYVKECSLSLDGSSAEIFCFTDSSTGHEDTADEIFQVLRICFLHIAQLNNLFAIHSASILYKEKAWLFSAPSGTGKSTHTNMWNDLYSTPVLNGDINLCTINNNQAEVVGTPWCGTSNIYTNKTYPLGGIILLKQYHKNIINTYKDDEKILLISKRLISSTWTDKMIDTNIEFCCKLIKLINVAALYCTKDTEAVETIKKYIDSVLDETKKG